MSNQSQLEKSHPDGGGLTFDVFKDFHFSFFLSPKWKKYQIKWIFVKLTALIDLQAIFEPQMIKSRPNKTEKPFSLMGCAVL